MPSRRKSVALPQKTVSELSPLHRILEFYLKTLIQPFLIYHGRFYKSINRFLWSFLETYGIPRAVTANAVTYTRTLLTFPTIYLLAKKKNIQQRLYWFFSTILGTFWTVLLHGGGFIKRSSMPKRVETRKILRQLPTISLKERMIMGIMTTQKHRKRLVQSSHSPLRFQLPIHQPPAFLTLE